MDAGTTGTDGAVAPIKTRLNICRIYNKARTIKSLSEKALCKVYKAPPHSATHKMEWFYKGVWGICCLLSLLRSLWPINLQHPCNQQLYVMYNLELLVLFSILCYFIPLLHCVLEANTVLFTSLHVFNNIIYWLLFSRFSPQHICLVYRICSIAIYLKTWCFHKA